MTDRPRDPMIETLRGMMSRRRVLQAAGIGGAVAAASACGIKSSAPSGGVSASGGPAPAPTASDQSATDKSLNWSNWPLYMDELDGKYPTLEAFQKQTGIKVTYKDDVNDNNDFYAKVSPLLQSGQPIDRDIVVLTDWMAALWIQKGYAVEFDRARIPNALNVIPTLADPTFDPGRKHTLPWQSGSGGLGWVPELLKEKTGKEEIRTLDELWDPVLKGRVTVLSEWRDTLGCIMSWQGANPADFTDAEFDAALAELTKQIDNGQIRQVTGNEYIQSMGSGDTIAVIGWSGDLVANGFGFAIPESGGTLWTDNMLIPTLAAHKTNAELAMNYYYQPEVAAELAAYVQYICPVEGAKEAMEKIDPTLVDNPYIFPTEKDLSNVSLFMTLTDQQQNKYQSAFQSAIGI